MVLVLGSIGLYCVIKLQEVEELILVSGYLASCLEIFLKSEFFFTLLGLKSLIIKYFWYSALQFSNLQSESDILNLTQDF